MAVRQTHLVDTDIESDPEEAPSEIEEFQPLFSMAPITGGEFEVSKPSDTRITSSHHCYPLTQASPTRVLFHCRTTCMAVRTQPTLSLGMSARIAEAAALSPSSFRKRYRSSYETPSPSSSPILPIRKRYRGTSELVEDPEEESSDSDTKREGSEDEGPSSDDEVVLVVDTAVDEPLGLRYGALRLHELALREGSMPSTFEVGRSSRFVPGHEGAERIYAFRLPTLVTWADPKDGRVYTDILTYVPPAAPIQTPPSLEWSSGS
ncbi:hypothetical protein Tco_1395001 [Tanacetum coccineum]